MRQRMLSEWLKDQFGTKVYKLSLTAGCTCPNRDGTVGTGGCTFCSEGGSGEFAAPFLPVRDQMRLAKERVNAKFPAKTAEEKRRYIAYFQSYTNTYGDPNRLKKLFTEAIEQPEICALSIGTRPDCLSEEILALLEELNRIKPVWVELGLQTIREKTAQKINRGYSLSVFEQAYRNLKKMGLTVVVHVILNLPGESEEDMLDTIRYLSSLSPAIDGIKLQQLQILKNTKLALEYENESFPLFSLEEYTDLLKHCLEILPESVIIHRLTGDGPKKLLIAPEWCADKKRVLNTLKKELGFS